MKKRKVCFITGTRADYGLMRNALKKIAKEFDLSLIVVGMHLSSEFGSTVKEIEKEGFKITKKIKTLLREDTGAAMVKSFGLTIIKITDVLEFLKPDWLLIFGDRGEALAGAMAGAYLNIPVVHLHGGDQGDAGAHIDDPIRHCITRLAHLHLPATKRSAERIRRMGEEKWRIHMVGSPALDDIFLKDFYPQDYLEKKYGLNLNKPLILAIQHPSLTQVNEAGKQITETLEALKEINIQTILIYPNADAGGRQMIKIIRQYEKYDFLRIYKSLSRKDYLSLMRYVKVMVGNSSSGTIDAPFFKIPVVNIGTRESVREHAGNKIFVGHNKKEIIRAIKKALFDKKFRKIVRKCQSPYGDGRSGQRITEILKKTKIDKKLLTKGITY